MNIPQDQSRTIKLSRGLVAVVDTSDYRWLSEWKWSALLAPRTAYAIRRDYAAPGQPMIYMHRLIMGATDGQEVDHIDHDGLNNRRSNMRTCTRAQNSQNQRPQSAHYKGICRDGTGWRALITANKKVHYIGVYLTAIGAAHAYNMAATELHGEFALLNKVTSEEAEEAERVAGDSARDNADARHAFGLSLRRKRERLGISQVGLSGASGVCAEHLCRVECGKLALGKGAYTRIKAALDLAEEGKHERT